MKWHFWKFETSAEIDVRVKPKGEDGPLTRFEVTDVEGKSLHPE